MVRMDNDDSITMGSYVLDNYDWMWTLPPDNYDMDDYGYGL